MGERVDLPGRAQQSIKLSALWLAGGLLVLLALTGWLHTGTRAALSQVGDYGLKWEVANAPSTGRVGLLMTFSSIKISNTGNQKWLSGGNDAARLGYRWFYPDGKPVPATGDTAWKDLRATLPDDIPPGGSIIFPDFQVAVPAKADSYVLHLDMGQGSDGWFATKGAFDYTLKVNVAPQDSIPPTATVSFLPLFQISTSFQVSWSGTDDPDGSGVATYDLQYKIFGEGSWTDWLQGTPQTSALFSGDNAKIYLFRARATDKAGNISTYPTTEQASTHVSILPPSARVATLPALSPSVFLVRWSGFDSVDGSDNQLFDVQFMDNGSGTWQDWQNATPGTGAVFKGLSGHSYYFRCRATNYAGLHSEYTEAAQAATLVNSVLDSTYKALADNNSAIITATTPAVTVSSTLSPAPSLTSATTVSQTIATTPAIPPLPTSTISVTVEVTATTTVSATTTISPTSAPISLLQTSAIFPLTVKKGDDNTGTTGIVIENPGDSPLDVFLRFSDHNGAPITTTINGVSAKTSPDQAQQASRIATLLVTVPPKANQTVWAGNLPVAAYNGWVALSANSPFQATAVRLPKAGQPLTYVAPTPATKLYLPYFKKAGPTGSTFINLANPNTVPADVQITYYDANNGQIIAAKTFQVPILGSLRIDTFGLASSNQSNAASEERLSGSAIISASVPLVASVELPQADGSYSTYAALTKTSDVLPSTLFYKDTDGIGTALAIQNAAKDPAAVKIEYFDTNGKVVGTDTVTVPAYGRALVNSEDILHNQPHFQGVARVSSANGNLAVVAIGGSSGLSSQQFP